MYRQDEITDHIVKPPQKPIIQVKCLLQADSVGRALLDNEITKEKKNATV